MTENKKKERKPLPKVFIDPMDTTRQWKPAGIKEIFGSRSDVFGKKRTKDIEKSEAEEEKESEEKDEGEDTSEEDEED